MLLDQMIPGEETIASRLSTVSIGIIVDIKKDTLICELYPGRPVPSTTGEASDTDGGTDRFPVAMPFNLQRTRFHGKTITRWDGVRIKYSYASDQERTATLVDDGTTEVQVIVPAYNPKKSYQLPEEVNDPIGDYKWHHYEGDQIVFARVTGSTGVDNVFYIDITPGRAWAKKKEEDE